ncbi:MAG: transcription antitermination factor NusB [Proteobacteria bacterium]|nr:transcription antitermination factor NusB [Pseudomonadota bacterium]
MGRESDARALSRARRAARKLLAQALYQLQIAGQPWQDIHHQFLADPESAGADVEFFKELLMGVADGRAALDATLARFSDIEPARLDPIEHGILWVALYELEHRLDVPFRVVISEAVELAKRFGATDGHKFVNAVLDRAAAALRPHERAG